MKKVTKIALEPPEISPLNTSLQSINMQKRLLVLVGLPARGKTYTAKRLTRYLNWIGIHTKLFNVGDYRRLHQMQEYKGHEFFSPNNKDAVKIRNYAADLALEDVKKWLTTMDGSVAILDATNSTRERRNMIINACEEDDIEVLFIELICTDDNFVRNNILEVKVSNPDYKSMDKEVALNDFMSRIYHYKTMYEPISEEKDKELSYIKIINRGDKLIMNNISDNISTRIIYFLMNLKVLKRTIYITRHGESIHNLNGKIGGNSELSKRGQVYAKKLTDYFNELKIEDLVIFTSLMKRTKQTAHAIECKKKIAWKILNELDAGHCDSMTYEEIHKKYPTEFARRDADKYTYRYPMGESYHDLINRIEPVMMALGSEKNILIVCHQAVARCLVGYYLDYKREEIPYIKIPLHEVTKLTPTAYGCISETIKFDIPSVDTQRNKPPE